MEDQNERSPQTFLGNNFSSFNRDENKTISALSSVSFEYRSGIKAASWILENKNGITIYSITVLVRSWIHLLAR